VSLFGWLSSGTCAAQTDSVQEKSDFISRYNLEKSEKIRFGFSTADGKIVSIATGHDDSYIVYRYGRKGNVEFEYPPKKVRSSFKLFDYSGYFRGGGSTNLGLNLQSVSFRKGKSAYEIYI